MSQQNKYFPNIPVMHFGNLRNLFKKSIPVTITPNYLASTMSMTESSAKANIIPSLRAIGLIDNDGKTIQDLAKKFRDDDQYKAFCDEVIAKIYPQEVRDAFPDKDADKDKVFKWFMNHTGVGESGTRRITAFYMALLDADPMISSSPKASKKKEVRAKVAPDKTPAKIVEPDNKTIHSDATTPKRETSRGPELNINLQIHISSDASAEQIKSIFENMSKYLYNHKIDE